MSQQPPIPPPPPPGSGSPLSSDPQLRQELHATIAARQELGARYEKELIDSFLRRLDQSIDGRIEQRIGSARAPQGYDPQTLKKYGNQINGFYFGIDFIPFETPNATPGMKLFTQQMKKLGKPINEQALAGWIDADMLYKGIKKAGPNFTQKSVIDAINTFNGYTADGLRPPINWGVDGHGPANNMGNTVPSGTEGCAAYVAAQNGRFVPQFGRPGQPFLGSGETGQGPAAASIANAIADATGKRLRDLPLTRKRIKDAIDA